jgi:hypothetical protein
VTSRDFDHERVPDRVADRDVCRSRHSHPALPNQDELASRERVSAAKGNDLMVERYAEILGATARFPDA